MIIMLLQIWLVCYLITRIILGIDDLLHNCCLVDNITDELYILIFWWLFAIIYLIGGILIIRENIIQLYNSFNTKKLYAQKRIKLYIFNAIIWGILGTYFYTTENFDLFKILMVFILGFLSAYMIHYYGGSEYE